MVGGDYTILKGYRFNTVKVHAVFVNHETNRIIKHCNILILSLQGGMWYKRQINEVCLAALVIP